MILFSWTLTPNQIECLKSVAEFQARDDAAIKAKRYNDSELGPPGVRNWIGATRLLFRENLIATHDVPVHPWERGHWTGKTRPKWEITQKGRLILQLVTLEIRDQMALLSSNEKELKRIAG